MTPLPLGIFRKREESENDSSGPQKKLPHLSDSDTDLHRPPPNSPLPADEQNINNILNFNDPHRNLSYIIEACVQKIVKFEDFVLKTEGGRGGCHFRNPQFSTTF